MKNNLLKYAVFALVAVVIIGASFLFATRYIYRSKAGVNDVVAQLQPATVSTTLNTPFSVAVWLQSDPTKHVSGATVPIQYDASKIEYVGLDTSDATCNAIDTQVALNNTNGQIVWSRVTFKAYADLPKGLFCFGKLQFKLTSGTSATIAYSTSGTATVVGPDGALTLTGDPSHSSVVVSTSAGASTPTPTPTTAPASCVGGGYSQSGACWYLGDIGQSCTQVCGGKSMQCATDNWNDTNTCDIQKQFLSCGVCNGYNNFDTMPFMWNNGSTNVCNYIYNTSVIQQKCDAVVPPNMNNNQNRRLCKCTTAAVSSPTPTPTPTTALCGTVACLPGWQCVSQVCVPVSPTPTPTTPAGASTPTPTPTTPPSAGTPVLNFKLKLQGVQSKPSGATQVPLRFTVVKKDGSFSKIFSNVVGTFNDGGNVIGTLNLTGVSAGSGYRLLVKGPKHLQRKYCNLTPTSTENGAYLCGENSFTLAAGANEFSAVSVPLLVGDLSPQDGLLNAFDIAQMNLNLLLGDADALNVADVNYDGFVNSTDFSLLIQSMQLKYDEEQ